MSFSIIHISDLHLRKGWSEEQGVVLDAFFRDLAAQTSQLNNGYMVFTGDILQSGDDNALYDLFTHYFKERLDALGLTRDRLVFLPGNHDVDRAYTQKNFSVLKALQERPTKETDFNNYIYKDQDGLILPKFKNFLKWQAGVSSFNLTEDNYCGAGFAISDDVGIYCVNTALYSFGGLRDENGQPINDEGFLPIETRRLHAWLQETKFNYRILAMHHPKSWLVDWAETEIHRIENSKFDLILCGHTHENSVFHKNDGKGAVVESVSPPLFTKKSEILGYSILHVDGLSKETEIHYRQWTGKSFVTGSAFSHTDDGIVRFGTSKHKAESAKNAAFDSVEHSLKRRFDESLRCYASLPKIWVTPRVADVAECSSDAQAVIQPAEQLIGVIDDIIINAPPQFGLSSLGHFIAWKTWVDMPGHYVLYLDSQELPNHETAIQKAVTERLLERGLDDANLHALVLDEHDQISTRKINNIKKLYPSIPLIVLNRVDYLGHLDKSITYDFDRNFKSYFLWSLDREQIREVVRQFIEAGNTLEEDSATQHLVDDLENLNLHRSPLNCLTLLTIYEQQIDYSPSNRTEMLERFLYLLFSAYKKRPNYSSYPDMKDSFYVLGQYCEKMIREGLYSFTKADFVAKAAEYCRDMAIDIDVSRLFDVMVDENVVAQKDNSYYFRYVHWIYFFAAHRMHHDAEFRKYIFNELRYVNMPEIIEFYSGIDRRRDELLEVLTSDLQRLNQAFEERARIGATFDPYSSAKWAPTDSQIDEMKQLVEQEIQQSSLPVSVKDRVADLVYDKSRPYIQEVSAFINESSFRECCQTMKASARALRNSDYVTKDKKVQMLDEILRTWSKIMQVLVVISPVLAKDKKARFENLGVYLDGSWPEFEEEGELWMAIMDVIPWNVVTYHEKDFTSARMAPLLIDYLENGQSNIGKYIVASCLLRQKPRGWLSGVKKYMLSLDKNSFYLYTMFNDVRKEY